MIQLGSRLKPADNSGAKSFKVIGIPVSVGRFAGVGDLVKCVVDGADSAGNLSDADKVSVLIVRTRKEKGRRDGTYVRFDDNAGVVVDGNGIPVGTRVLGPVAREVKEKGFSKIASLAKEVV